jgi:hypothetical protein
MVLETMVILLMRHHSIRLPKYVTYITVTCTFMTIIKHLTCKLKL